VTDPDILFEGRRFRVRRQEHRTADGTLHVREIVEHPGAVVVLPLLSDGQVCLIRNYRTAVGRTLIELPAGTLEPGEPHAETARRELAEETGYRAESMTLLHEFFMSPGILNERMFLYDARGLTLGERHLDAGEQIENLVVTWSEAVAMADDGRIEDAKTLVGILYHDHRLRSGQV